MTSTTSAKAVNAATQVITVSITRMVWSPMPGKSGTPHVEIVTRPRNIITRLRSCSKRNRALQGGLDILTRQPAALEGGVQHQRDAIGGIIEMIEDIDGAGAGTG